MVNKIREKLDIVLKYTDCDKMDGEEFNNTVPVLVDFCDSYGKYAWHNLEENPKDLPSIYHSVIIAVEDIAHVDGIKQYIYAEATYNGECWLQFRWGSTYTTRDSRIVAWKEIEPLPYHITD